MFLNLDTALHLFITSMTNVLCCNSNIDILYCMLNQLSLSEIVVLFIAILISMVVHEACHGYVAYWLGDNTALEHGRLTFNPLKSIDLLTTILLPMVLVLFGLMPFFAAKPVPINPRNLKFGNYGSALVGVAGPISNLLMAVVVGLFLRFLGAGFSPFFQSVFIIFIEVNIGLFIFNMIPFPPLDGSRLLYAFAPEFIQEIMLRIESFGFFSILIFMLLVLQFIITPISNIELGLLKLIIG